ncbi:META domain-containing protein [Spirosoma foliorum]|uniref:META domain-containing protein n=1 Tax=Spirosoma foliorum TaxID=2710596 RepID=A0A7G5GTD4_9BACT|nr:META domain-containing protein [Spirosoma foliorum]QMW02126.1 META domain-containing protein [Spirosoma foliorum]
MRFVAISCLLLITLALSQCTKSQPELAPKIAELIGTWQLVDSDSTYAVTLIFTLDTDNPPHDITSFKASGKSSINTYNLNLFAAIDGLMVADQLGSTKVAGSPAATQFEQQYFKNLKAVARFELPTANELRLYHGGDLPRVLVYKKLN